MASMRSLAGLIKEIEQKICDPDMTQLNYWRHPLEREVMAVRTWLRNQGIEEPYILALFHQADFEGRQNDTTWLEAVHRIANRNVRKNAAGWCEFNGDWVKLQAMLR
jgi:hypothetical protein